MVMSLIPWQQVEGSSQCDMKTFSLEAQILRVETPEILSIVATPTSETHFPFVTAFSQHTRAQKAGQDGNLLACDVRRRCL